MAIRVSTDSVAYFPGERVRVTIEASRGAELVILRGSEVVERRVLSEERVVEEVEVKEAGVYIARVVAGEEVEDAKFIVVERLEHAPRIAIVFHDHQAPNYSPDGSIRESWAFEHIWNHEFKPYYEGGAYYVQAKLLGKWRIRMSLNLSPSLLKQWSDLLDRGVVIDRGGFYECVEPSDERAEMVEETLEMFKELARSGVIDVLTSFYSHPLAGYIADAYGWLDLLSHELRMGREVTEGVMGVEPRGAWLPEMSFSMKLLPILEGEGVEYTVLDGINHFAGALGEKDSVYQLYALKSIKVFFRHTGISDLWSFKYSNVNNVGEAEAGARDLAIRIVAEAHINKAEVLTIALDGENWMVLPRPKPAAAVLLDKLLGYLRRAEELGLIRLVKLCEVVDEIEPRLLVSVPSRSWRGGYEKWLSERRRIQESIWRNVVEAYECFKALQNAVGVTEEDVASLMHVVNSDHIWAEFADEGFSAEWRRVLESRLEGVLSSIRIVGAKGHAVHVMNLLKKSVRVTIYRDSAASLTELKPGLNAIRVEGGVMRIVVRGWRREHQVGKPILIRPKIEGGLQAR